MKRNQERRVKTGDVCDLPSEEEYFETPAKSKNLVVCNFPCCSKFHLSFLFVKISALHFVGATALAPAEFSVDEAPMKLNYYPVDPRSVLYSFSSLKVFLFLVTTKNSECRLSRRRQ
jgi:hypothetical protein